MRDIRLNQALVCVREGSIRAARRHAPHMSEVVGQGE